MPLGIGKERITGLENRCFQAQRRQHILHRPASLAVHVHIAGGHQRQVASLGQGL